jgi:hypothetical protein
VAPQKTLTKGQLAKLYDELAVKPFDQVDPEDLIDLNHFRIWRGPHATGPVRRPTQTPTVEVNDQAVTVTNLGGTPPAVARAFRWSRECEAAWEQTGNPAFPWIAMHQLLAASMTLPPWILEYLDQACRQTLCRRGLPSRGDFSSALGFGPRKGPQPFRRALTWLRGRAAELAVAAAEMDLMVSSAKEQQARGVRDVAVSLPGRGETYVHAQFLVGDVRESDALKAASRRARNLRAAAANRRGTTAHNGSRSVR